MSTWHQRFDDVAPVRSGEHDLESERASVDRIQARIAEKLHRAADTLFGRTDYNKTPREGANFGAQASAWLHNSADYIEQTDPKQMKADITEQVRRNPGKSLLVAGAFGLILGSIFRRR